MDMKNQNTENKNQQFKTEIVCDVNRSETEIYRLARKEYQGERFVDIRLFFRAKEDRDRLIPTHKGIWVEERSRQDLISGLIKARKADPVERPEGEKVHSIVICDIPASETEVIRISKGCGSKYAFVDIRRFFKKDGDYFPYKRKGISVQESCVDDLITGLMRAERTPAS